MKLARINLAVEICTAVFDPPRGDEAARQIRPCHFDLQVDFVRPQRQKHTGKRGRRGVSSESNPERSPRDEQSPVIGRSDKPAVAFRPGKVPNFI